MIHRVNVTNDVLVGSAEQVAPKTGELDSLRQKSFSQFLNNAITVDDLSFSAHALARLEQRNIVVDEQIKNQLENAIDKIAQKGGKESLIMLDNVAYVVSIPNKTVITALETAQENVFTNIDSALVLN